MIYVVANNEAAIEAYAELNGIDKDSVVRVSSIESLKNTCRVTLHVLIGYIDSELETMLYIISVRKLANIVYKKLVTHQSAI